MEICLENTKNIYKYWKNRFKGIFQKYETNQKIRLS